MSDYWTGERRYSQDNPSLRPLKLAPSIQSSISIDNSSAIDDDVVDTHAPLNLAPENDKSQTNSDSNHHNASSFSSDSSTDIVEPNIKTKDVLKPIQNTPPMTPLALEITEAKAMTQKRQ